MAEARRGGPERRAPTEEEITRADRLLKAFGPRREEHPDLFKETDNAIKTAEEMVATGRQVDREFGLNLRQTEARLGDAMVGLGQKLEAIGSEEFAGMEQRYANPASRIHKTLQDAQSKLSSGDMEGAQTSFHSAQKSIENLSTVMKNVRNLVASGAPDELIQASDSSLAFIGTKNEARIGLIADATKLFLEKRDTLMSEQGSELLGQLTALTRRVGDPRQNIDIQTERDNLTGFQRRAENLETQLRSDVLRAFEIQRQLLQQALAQFALREQITDLLDDLADLGSRLSDEKTASGVGLEEIGKMATMILAAKSMISSLDELADNPQLQQQVGTAYSAALKILASTGNYRLFKILIFAANQLKLHPGNDAEAYRKDILANILQLVGARTLEQRAEGERKLTGSISRLFGELEKDPAFRKIFDVYISALFEKFVKKKDDAKTNLLVDGCLLFFSFKEKGREEDGALAKDLVLRNDKTVSDTSKMQFTILSMLNEIDLNGLSNDVQNIVLGRLRRAFSYAKEGDLERASLIARVGSLLANYEMLTGKGKGGVENEYKGLEALYRQLTNKEKTAITKDHIEIIEDAASAFTRAHELDAIDAAYSSIEKTPEIKAKEKEFLYGVLSRSRVFANREDFGRVEEILKHVGFLQIVFVKKCPFGEKELREILSILGSEELGEAGIARMNEINTTVIPRVNDYLLLLGNIENLDGRVEEVKNRFSEAASVLKTDVNKLIDFKKIREKRADAFSALQKGDFVTAEKIVGEASELFASEIELGSRKVELLNDLATVSANAEGMQRGMGEYENQLRNLFNDLRAKGEALGKFSRDAGTDMMAAGNVIGNGTSKEEILYGIAQARVNLFDFRKLQGIRSVIEAGRIDDAKKLLNAYQRTELKRIQEGYASFVKTKCATEFLVGELYAAEQYIRVNKLNDSNLNDYVTYVRTALIKVQAGNYKGAQADFNVATSNLSAFLKKKVKDRPGDIGMIILSKQKRFSYALDLLGRDDAVEAGVYSATGILAAYESMGIGSILSDNRMKETLDVTTSGITAIIGMMTDISGSLDKKEVRERTAPLFNELVRTLALEQSALSAEDEINKPALFWANEGVKSSGEITKSLAGEAYDIADLQFRFVLSDQSDAVKNLTMDANKDHPIFLETSPSKLWLGEKRYELIQYENAFKGMEIKDFHTRWYVENTLKDMDRNFDDISSIASLVVWRLFARGEGKLERQIFDLSKVVIDLRVKQAGYLLEKCRKGEVHNDEEWTRIQNEFLQNELKSVDNQDVKKAISKSMEKFGAFSLDMALIQYIGEAKVKEIYGKMGRDVVDIIGAVIPGYGTVVSLARSGRVDAITVIFDAVSLIPFAGSMAKGTRALAVGVRTARAVEGGAVVMQRLALGYKAYAAERAAIGFGEALGMAGKSAKVVNYLEKGSAIAGITMGLGYSGYALATQGFNRETVLGAVQASLAPISWGAYALASRRPAGSPPHWLFEERNPFMWMDERVQNIRIRANAETIRAAEANGYPKGAETKLLDNLRTLRQDLVKTGKTRSQARALAEKELVGAGGNLAKAKVNLGLAPKISVERGFIMVDGEEIPAVVSERPEIGGATVTSQALADAYGNDVNRLRIFQPALERVKEVRSAVVSTMKETGVSGGFGFSGSTAQMTLMSTFSDIDMMNFVVAGQVPPEEAAAAIAKYIAALNGKVSGMAGVSPGTFKLSGKGGRTTLNLNAMTEKEIANALLKGCDDFLKMDYIVNIPGIGPTEQTIVLKVGFYDAKGKIRTISGDPGKLRTSANSYQSIMNQGASYKYYDKLVRDLEGFAPFSEENKNAMARDILVKDIQHYSELGKDYNPLKAIKRALTLSLTEGNRNIVDQSALILDSDVNTAYTLTGRLEAAVILQDPKGPYVKNAEKALAGMKDLLDNTNKFIDRASLDPGYKKPELLDNARNCLNANDLDGAGKALKEWVNVNSEDTLNAVIAELEKTSGRYKQFKH